MIQVMTTLEETPQNISLSDLLKTSNESHEEYERKRRGFGIGKAQERRQLISQMQNCLNTMRFYDWSEYH